MKKIEEYLQFVYDKEKYEVYTFFNDTYVAIMEKESEHRYEGSIIDLITSKEFIEAIARGYIDSGRAHIVGEVNPKMIINDITSDQAIAIRDNTLDEFITNILPGSK